MDSRLEAVLEEADMNCLLMWDHWLQHCSHLISECHHTHNIQVEVEGEGEDVGVDSLLVLDHLHCLQQCLHLIPGCPHYVQVEKVSMDSVLTVLPIVS